MSTLAGADLARSFGGVVAVDGVDVTVEEGEVLAVVGPNGSGKSTLIDVLTGVVSADRGTVSVASRRLGRVSPAVVARRGVRRTFQGGRLIEGLTAQENVCLGLHRGPGIRVGSPTRRRSLDAIEALGISHLASRRTAELSVGERRRVELARALVGRPVALVLDEPTAGLPTEDGARLTDQLRDVASTGVGVLLIEHNLPLVRRVADRVMLLVDGRVGAEGAVATVDAALRSALGVPEEATPRRQAVRGDALLAVRGMSARRGGRLVLDRVDLDLHAGEVVALFGGNGSGKSTLLAALSGLVPADGRVHLRHTDLAPMPTHERARAGVAHLPQRRHLFGSLSVQENLVASDAALAGREPVALDDVLGRFPELQARLHSRVGLLSGGEQQMVTVARGLRTSPIVVLADEPTAALAPDARRRVLCWLRALADSGATVLIAEQNVAETTAVADRLLVMQGGRLVDGGDG